jgi:hypothetical protein
MKKTEELLVKQLKSCEKNMKESMKRSNLRVMGIEEEEVQAKGIHNIVNEIIIENSPHLEKVSPTQVQEASRTPNRLNQYRTSQWQIVIKTTSTENREGILKVVRETKNNI